MLSLHFRSHRHPLEGIRTCYDEDQDLYAYEWVEVVPCPVLGQLSSTKVFQIIIYFQIIYQYLTELKDQKFQHFRLGCTMRMSGEVQLKG